MIKNIIGILLFASLSFFAQTEEPSLIQVPTCSSRVISLIPKTIKYQNQIAKNRQFTCKSASLPSFAALDQRCYLIMSPQSTGLYQIAVQMKIIEKKPDGTQSISYLTLPYILTITKIRYTSPQNQQEVQYDITVNRIINIQTSTTTWLLSPGQAFFAQFKVNQTTQIYERILYEYVNLPSGLKGNQLSGVVEGNLQVPPGYYSFSVKAFDLQGNSETLEATILVNDPNSKFIQQDFQDQQTLKQKSAQIDNKISQNTLIISNTKTSIEKQLQIISTSRSSLSELQTQQRKLEGTQNSLSYASNWASTNLQNMKLKFNDAQTKYNDFQSTINDAKRTYQTSVFSIKQKQSQISKEQLEADKNFETYLQADKNYSHVRMNLDECERKNKKIALQAEANLKQLDRVNFVQNLYDIIKNN